LFYVFSSLLETELQTENLQVKPAIDMLELLIKEQSDLRIINSVIQLIGEIMYKTATAVPGVLHSTHNTRGQQYNTKLNYLILLLCKNTWLEQRNLEEVLEVNICIYIYIYI